jgi:hypothetical protein
VQAGGDPGQRDVGGVLAKRGGERIAPGAVPVRHKETGHDIRTAHPGHSRAAGSRLPNQRVVADYQTSVLDYVVKAPPREQVEAKVLALAVQP